MTPTPGPGHGGPQPAGSPLVEVVAAAAAERDATPSGRLVDLGPARRDSRRTTPFVNAFIVDTGPRRQGSEALTQLYLSRAAVGAAQFRVTRVHAWDANELLVEADTNRDGTFEDLWDEQSVRDGSMRVYGGASVALQLKSVAERLASLRDANLGAFVLAGSARAAAPGTLQVIIGSRARRTEALGAAAAQLVAAGRSVLVVSADNDALDATTLAAQRWAGEPGGGTIVRVGVCGRAIADDPRLTVDGAAARRAPDALAQAAAAANELRGVLESARTGTASTPSTVSPASPGGPQGHESTDAQGGPAAPVVPARPEDLHLARAELSEAEAHLAAALGDAREAAAAHGAARTAVKQFESARLAYRRIDELARQVQDAAAEAAASAAGVSRVANQASAASARQLGAATRQLVVAAEVATTRLDRRDRALADLEAATAHAAALGVNRSQLQAVEDGLSRARGNHARAERAALAARAARARAAAKVADCQRRLPAPVPAAMGATGVEALGRGSAPIDQNVLRELRARHGKARAVVNSQQAPAIGAAKIVVTTIGHLVANPAVYERSYDHVFIDDANALAPVFIVWAASRATAGVTLATELEARPPQPAAVLAPPLARWLAAPVLSLVGLASPESVRAFPGSLVLD